MYKFYDTEAIINLKGCIFSPGDVILVSLISVNEFSNNTHKYQYILDKLGEHLKDPNFIIYTSKIYVEPNCHINNILLSDYLLQDILNISIQYGKENLIVYTSNLWYAQCLDSSDIKCNFVFKEKIEKVTYDGYHIITTEDELSILCEDLALEKPLNVYNLKENEYIIVDVCNEEKNSYGYCWRDNHYVPIKYQKIKSYILNTTIKPLDIYQQCLLDSFQNNFLSLARGHSGTGKTILALGFFMSKLEKNELSKIIIFCNTVPAAGAVQLGMYPGTKDDKLLDSQIGNVLKSKLGAKKLAELMAEEKLVLLPMSDLRGYDTSINGEKTGVYITEAQNLDVNLMKLALQRIGENSICIIDGDDDAQVDLPQYKNENNGIKKVLQVFSGEDVFGTIKLKNIYRSKIAEIAEKL